MCLYLLFNLVRLIAIGLPLKVAYRAAIFFADAHFLLSGADRRSLMENLRAAGISDQRELDRIARESFRNFAKYLIDFFRFSKIDDNYLKQQVRVTGRENLDKALEKGKGVIIASGHLGNWELGAAVISNLGYKLNVVALVHKHPLVNSLFVRQRERVGVGIIALGGDARYSLEALGRGELVAIVGDRDFSANGVKIQFFGHQVSFPRGSALFHIKEGIPIVPTFVIRQPDDTFEVIFEPEPEVGLTGDKEIDQRAIVQSWAWIFEKYVRKYPNQWFMFRPFWSEGANKL